MKAPPRDHVRRGEGRLRTAGLALCSIFVAVACQPTSRPELPSDSPVPSPSATVAAPPTASPAASPTVSPTDGSAIRSPTIELFLRYLAKTLSGTDGWETPFIIQNADTVATDLELDFNRMSDGARVAHEIVNGLQPGRSYADRPDLDESLPGDAALSAVVRSYGAKVVAVVNQQRGAGARFESDSYVSQIGGRQRLFVPSALRGVDGFFSTIFVQNVDVDATDATAEFLSATGGVAATATRHLLPGRSGIIELATAAGLADGARYPVRIAATRRLVAIVSSRRDRPSDKAPAVYTFKALGDADGANIVDGPYTVKNAPDGQWHFPLPCSGADAGRSTRRTTAEHENREQGILFARPSRIRQELCRGAGMAQRHALDEIRPYPEW